MFQPFQKEPFKSFQTWCFQCLTRLKVHSASKFKLKREFMITKILSSISSIRPINFLISERPEYKISCLIGDVNHVRLVVIALANILSAAPAEDKYGVTQVGLKESLKLFNRLNKGLDIIVRNNQQR